MVMAVLMINVNEDGVNAIASQIAEFDGVTEAYSLTGK